ncbi:MAG: EMC3/TMCO1 family protein [Candidatus Pacearchaeota archaeon]|nr:EMC3/TMCO1 family protein [Candidatus Pacearchaeota archaeon]
MDNEGSNKFMLIMLGFMLVGFVILFLWNSVPALKNAVAYVLDPTAGALINWNLTIGSLIVFFIIALITTIAQKYLTDQETLRELKKEQKALHKDMEKYRDNPKKMMEIQKSVWPTTMKIMQVSMKSSIFTLIPFILFFRWFMDLFVAMGSPKFFGFLSWFWFYLLSVLIFSSFLRKWLNVA